nr:hypothetical protein [Roseomonas sp. CECT 9278]
MQVEGSVERKAFETFLAEIRDDLNDSPTEDEGIEMLAQHVIARPVFDPLFEGYSFAANNPVSTALQGVPHEPVGAGQAGQSEDLRAWHRSRMPGRPIRLGSWPQEHDTPSRETAQMVPNGRPEGTRKRRVPDGGHRVEAGGYLRFRWSSGGNRNPTFSGVRRAPLRA